MKNLNYMSIAEDAINKIKKGAFLTVKAAGAINTMTIGWATFGFIWQKPVMMVAVRPTRHTFGIIEKAQDFTVTIPANDMSKAIAFCGSKSGRDVDKLKKCSLETARIVRAEGCVADHQGAGDLVYGWKIVLKSAMNPAFLDKDIDKSIYPQKDYHTLYFGEIVACYETE